MQTQLYETIGISELLGRLAIMRNEGFSLAQILATRIETPRPLEALYVMERGESLYILRVELGAGEPIESVSGLFAYAYLYENEMKDLYGIDVLHMNIDFAGNLYKTSVKTPFNPAQTKEGENL